MFSVKMIILDLDDTLLRSDKTISERMLQTLWEYQAQGIVVVIATARFWIGAEKYIGLIQAADAEAEIATAVGKRVYWNSL